MRSIKPGRTEIDPAKLWKYFNELRVQIELHVLAVTPGTKPRSKNAPGTTAEK